MMKIIEGGVSRTTAKGEFVCIPDDSKNRDWRTYQEWLAAGNTPLPADPKPDPGPTREEKDQEAKSILISLGLSDADADRLIELLR